MLATPSSVSNAATDWSLFISILAFVVSLAGTILGPIINTVLSNQHELHILKLNNEAKLQAEKQKIIRDCVASIGKCVSYMSPENTAEFGEHFHNVYAYVDPQKWTDLDAFYELVISGDPLMSQIECAKIIRILTPLLD